MKSINTESLIRHMDEEERRSKWVFIHTHPAEGKMCPRRPAWRSNQGVTASHSREKFSSSFSETLIIHLHCTRKAKQAGRLWREGGVCAVSYTYLPLNWTNEVHYFSRMDGLNLRIRSIACYK